jgi:excisionase family DNA binding protein
MADLTTNEVAQRLKAAGIRGGSRPTVIRWSDEGWLPHYKTFGGGYRMYREEVIQLLIDLWRGGNTNMEQVREKLFALHEQLAEREHPHGKTASGTG